MEGAALIADALGRVNGILHRSLKGAPAGMLCRMPAPHANSMAWLAWHLTVPRNSRLMLWRADLRGRARVVARSRSGVVANPSLTRGHIMWVDQRAEVSRVLLKPIASRKPPRTIFRVAGRNLLVWTTALSPRRAYVTRWTLADGRSRLVGRSVSAP